MPTAKLFIGFARKVLLDHYSIPMHYMPTAVTLVAVACDVAASAVVELNCSHLNIDVLREVLILHV